jgi:prepilin peptidase CpaA
MLPTLIIVAGLAVAVVADVRTRRIPNALTASMAGAGFVVAAAGFGVTPMQALLGLLVGLLVMMPGHLIGATGAGDVKLLAAIGSLVGPSLAFRVCLYTAVAGGAIALAVAARRGLLAYTLHSATQLVVAPAGARQAIAASSRASRFAYGPAIAVGTLVALAIR